MDVLIAGNSQAVRLMTALRQTATLVPADWNVTFVLTPGGTGPYLGVEGGMLVETRQHPDFPTRCAPSDALSRPVASYDAIVVSALGYVDGGFRFDNPIYRRGALWRFKPHDMAINPSLVSESCLREVTHGMLNHHHGTHFLKALRPAYTGRILVQQFPLLSADIRQRADWRLKEVYSDPEGMHAFLVEAASAWLKSTCDAVGAELLPPPSAAVVNGVYTAPQLMSESDLYHTTAEYAAMVLEQVVSRLS